MKCFQHEGAVIRSVFLDAHAGCSKEIRLEVAREEVGRPQKTIAWVRSEVTSVPP